MDNDDVLSSPENDFAEALLGEVIQLPLPVCVHENKVAAHHKLSVQPPSQITFDRRELSEILRIYGRYVAFGEWRDYAIDFQKDRAVFSIFKRSSEMPVYRVEKDPRMARKQGAYAVVNTNGLILKRGHDLAQVLRILEKSRYLRLVD